MNGRRAEASNKQRGASCLPNLVLVIAVALTAFVYWPGLNGPLLLDDVANLGIFRSLQSQGLLDLSSVLEERSDGLAGRPVSMISFLLNWKLTGDDLWFLKLGNLVVHLLCGVLVYLLAGRLLSLPICSLSTAGAAWLSTWTAAVWMLAPLHVSTVLYVVQRMAQLAAAFVLIGMLSYLVGRQKLAERPMLGWSLITAALVVSWPLAALSKQNGILLPAFILLVELFFLQPREVDPHRRRVLLSIPLLVVLLTATALIGLIALEPGRFFADYAVRDFTPGERLLTQFRALVDYAANALLVPGGEAMGLFHDGYQKSTGIFSPWTTLPAALLWCVPVALGVRHAGTRSGLLFFGPLFFLVGHLVESSVFPLELYFEHRNYLPSVGLFLFVSLLAARICATSVIRARLLAAALCALAAIYGVVAGARVLTWTSWERLVRYELEEHPSSVRAQAAAAILHLREGEIAQARPYLERVQALGGEVRRHGVALKLIVGYCALGQTPSDEVYRALERLPPASDHPYTLGASSWLREEASAGRCEAVDLGRVARALAPRFGQAQGQGPYRSNWRLLFDVASLFELSGDQAQAAVHFARALPLAPPSRAREIRHRLERLLRAR